MKKEPEFHGKVLKKVKTKIKIERGQSRLRLSPGMNYKSHPGKRSNTRNLKNLCRPLFKNVDQEAKDALSLVKEMIKDEYLYYRFILEAKRMSDSSGVTLLEAMNNLAEKMREEINEARKQTNESGVGDQVSEPPVGDGETNIQQND